MSQHTPGPWIHNPSPEPQNADRHVCVNIPSGFARVIVRVKHTDVDDALANARLIAAAPEMQEAIRALLLICDDGPIPKAARALLAKIEGKA